jgi:hypothetical protein
MTDEAVAGVVMMPTKTCRKCDIEQPIVNFYRAPKNRDGLKHKCKVCNLYEKHQWALANKKRIKEYNRAYEAIRPRSSRMTTDAAKKKAKVRSKLRTAIRSGMLKAQPCEWCGSIPAEAHHPNYVRPLDVMWLCKKHHGDLHSANNALRRSAA